MAAEALDFVVGAHRRRSDAAGRVTAAAGPGSTSVLQFPLENALAGGRWRGQ